MRYLARTDGDCRIDRRSAVWCGVALLVALLGVTMGGCAPDNRSAGGATETSQAPAPSAQTPSRAGASNGHAKNVLVSAHVGETPLVDGDLNGGWDDSAPMELPLTWGWGGDEIAMRAEFRSLHSDEMVCFGARWTGQPPHSKDEALSNELTVHWEIPAWQVGDKGHLDCTVVCHTAFADAQGRISYMNSETIPQGGDAALPAAGQWKSGVWTIEWCRPLQSENPYDLQFSSLDAEYAFRVKIFESVEGRPDLVSGPAFLRFDT